jgi:hypothetical protein
MVLLTRLAGYSWPDGMLLLVVDDHFIDADIFLIVAHLQTPVVKYGIKRMINS